MDFRFSSIREASTEWQMFSAADPKCQWREPMRPLCLGYAGRGTIDPHKQASAVGDSDTALRLIVQVDSRMVPRAHGAVAEYCCALHYSGLLTSRPYFGAKSMSRAMVVALGGPDGPTQLTTGSAISAQKFSNPAGVKMTNPFPGPAPIFWYVWTVPLGTRKKEPGPASTVRRPRRNENLPSIM